MKKYPSYSDFSADEIMYGIGAPYVGIGIYTLDKKFSWPDPQGTMKNEYEAWIKWLSDQGYEVPTEYVNAYYDYKTETPPTKEQD